MLILDTRDTSHLSDISTGGINIRRHVHELSRFADDASVFVASLMDAEYLFGHTIPIYERTTGMKMDANKTEGLRIKSNAYNLRVTHQRTPAGAKEGDWIILLGFPISSNLNSVRENIVSA